MIRRHAESVWRTCLRVTGAVHDAQDAFQATWCILLAKGRSIREMGSAAAWLHRVAVNTVLAHRRRNAGWLRRVVTGVDELPEPEVHERPDQVRDLESAIAQLPERARQVFVLVDVEGYGHREAAELMGIAEGTSKAQLSRARSLLREILA